MSPTNAHIQVDGHRGKIEVGGTELNGVRAVSLDAKAGHLTEMTVTFALRDAEVDGQMLVIVDDKTKASLVALGWAPPEQSMALRSLATYFDAFAAAHPSDTEHTCDKPNGCHTAGQAFTSARAALLIRQAIEKIPRREVPVEPGERVLSKRAGAKLGKALLSEVSE